MDRVTGLDLQFSTDTHQLFPDTRRLSNRSPLIGALAHATDEYLL